MALIAVFAKPTILAAAFPASERLSVAAAEPMVMSLVQATRKAAGSAVPASNAFSTATSNADPVSGADEMSAGSIFLVTADFTWL